MGQCYHYLYAGEREEINRGVDYSFTNEIEME